MENIKKFYPFFKSRMIDIATQKAFGSSFMLATRQVSEQKGRYFKNLSFPLYLPGQTAVVGFEERGKPRLDGTSGYKGKALGSNSSEGLWIASPNGTELKDAKMSCGLKVPMMQWHITNYAHTRTSHSPMRFSSQLAATQPSCSSVE